MFETYDKVQPHEACGAGVEGDGVARPLLIDQGVAAANQARSDSNQEHEQPAAANQQSPQRAADDVRSFVIE